MGEGILRLYEKTRSRWRTFSFSILSERWRALPPPSRRSTALAAFFKENIYLVRGWLGWVYRCHDVCVEVGGRRLGVSSLYCENSRDQGQGIRLGSKLPAPWTFPNVPHCTFSCSPGLLAHQLVTDDYCYYWFESHLCHLPCLFLAILPKLSVLLMCK